MKSMKKFFAATRNGGKAKSATDLLDNYMTRYSVYRKRSTMIRRTEEKGGSERQSSVNAEMVQISLLGANHVAI